MGPFRQRENDMNVESIMRIASAEGAAKYIDNLFQVIYSNICNAYGGEDKINPFHLADIRGSLTRAKHAALIPAQEIISAEKARSIDPADQPSSDSQSEAFCV